MKKDIKIYVSGHRGMVGSALMRALREAGYENIITATSSELDLRNQSAVNDFVGEHQPEVILLAAARVGGILANDSYPYTFLYDNLMIESNVINAAHQNDIEHLIYLGSSCIYPKFADQPIKESSLLTGQLEPTNEWYAIAKIAGVKLCEALSKQYNRSYVSLMPTNLYGPNDNFDLKTSHVLPALIRKFHEAKPDQTVTLWGTGSPLREFLHVDDLAQAILFAMENAIPAGLYNVGFGEDISIKNLAEVIQHVVGHLGDITWDSEKPDGTPKKLMDSTKFRSLGWEPEIGLKQGIQYTYEWFLNHQNEIKQVTL
jgi:GDP-L-fucose synthase